MSFATARSSPISRATNSPRSASSIPRSRRPSEMTRDGRRRPLRRAGGAELRRWLARAAAGSVAGAGARRDRLSQSARDQLFRLHADAESGDPDRAGDAWRRCSSSPATISICRSAPSSASSAASRRPGCATSPGSASSRSLGCIGALRGARRADLSAQPALDRGDARHELRLAGSGDPALAEARRHGARLAADDHGRQAALPSLSRSSPPR